MDQTDPHDPDAGPDELRVIDAEVDQALAERVVGGSGGDQPDRGRGRIDLDRIEVVSCRVGEDRGGARAEQVCLCRLDVARVRSTARRPSQTACTACAVVIGNRDTVTSTAQAPSATIFSATTRHSPIRETWRYGADRG
jgi:hypothetical protein